MILDQTRWLLLQAAFCQGEQAVAAYRSWRSGVAFEDIDSSAFRVLGQLARTASKFDIDEPDILRLRGALKHTWSSNMLRARALSVALSAIERMAVESLVINGAALFIRFPDLAKTHVADDFDILVRDRDSIVAVSTLASAGFRLPVGISLKSFQSQGLARVRVDALLSEVKSCSVNLHWWPLPGWTRDGFIDELLSRGERRLVGGQKIVIPELADHLYLTLASSRSGEQDEVFSRVVEATHLLRESNATLDWPRILQLCRRFHRGEVARAVLSLVRSDLGVSVPTKILDELCFLESEGITGIAVE